MSAVSSNDLSSLLVHDQLNKEMRTNRAFRLRSFTEAPITFAPTYKYNRGTSRYDSSEKKRIPAWWVFEHDQADTRRCDRILFTDSPRIRSLSYRRFEPTVSDHRPVSAGLQITLKRVDVEKSRQVKADVGEQWASREVELLGKMAEVFARLW